MKLIYKPFAIIAGLIASRLGRSVFRSIWTRIDEAPPPKPGSDGSLGKIVGGQALQAGVMSGTRATVDHLFARVFHHLVGVWPQDPPKREKED